MEMKRRLATLAATSMAAASTIVGFGALAESASAACPGSPGWITGNNQRFNDAFTSDYVPIKVAPYANADCARVGYGHQWHDIASHCVAQNANNVWWLHLWDRDIAVNGWSQIANLRGDITAVYC